MTPTDYCESLHGKCVCKGSDRPPCAKMVREAADAAIREESLKKAEEAQRKEAQRKAELRSSLEEPMPGSGFGHYLMERPPEMIFPHREVNPFFPSRFDHPRFSIPYRETHHFKIDMGMARKTMPAISIMDTSTWEIAETEITEVEVYQEVPDKFRVAEFIALNRHPYSGPSELARPGPLMLRRHHGTGQHHRARYSP